MPQRQIRTPDGVIHNFPEAATDDQVAEALASWNKPTPENTFAIVGGQKIPLGGDEADLPPTEGFFTKPGTGERILQSAITPGSKSVQRITQEGDWKWNPPATKDRVDDSMFRVGGHADPETGLQTGGFAPTPEQALSATMVARNVVLPIGRAVVGAAPGVASRTAAAAAASAPMIKYEVSKRVLMKLGIPEVIAAPIASKISGWEGKSAANKAEAAEATRLKEVKAIDAAAQAKATTDAAARAAIAANPPRVAKGGSDATLEGALQQELQSMMGQPAAAAPTKVTLPVAPGSTMTPGGMPSVRPGFSYQAPAPAAAPAPTATGPAGPTAWQSSTVTPQTPPVVDVRRPPAAAAPTSAGLTPKETEIFHEAKAAGLSDADTKTIINESRAALGTPRVLSWKPGKGPSAADAQKMSEMVGSRQAARNLKTTQDQIKTLRGSSVPALPHNVKVGIDAKLATMTDPADIAAYIKAAPNEAVLHYLKFKLGIP